MKKTFDLDILLPTTRGTNRTLAKALGVSDQQVCRWRAGTRKIPSDCAARIACMTGTVAQVQPDGSWLFEKTGSTPITIEFLKSGTKTGKGGQK